MSQLEDKHKKDAVQTDNEENRLQIGELKWSTDDEEKSNDEVSAGLAALEETKDEEELIFEEIKPEKDPLNGIEDTLTPIDFKTYNFEANQFKEPVEESNYAEEYTLEEEDWEEEEQTSSNRWLKVFIFILGLPVLLAVVLLVSLIIGHSVIGGQPVSDIFDMNTWQHLYNLIYG